MPGLPREKMDERITIKMVLGKGTMCLGCRIRSPPTPKTLD